MFFRKILTLFHFKPLILTLPAMFFNNFLLLQFFWHFFLHTPSSHHLQINNNKSASWNKMLVKFYIPQWKVNNVRTKIMVTPIKKEAPFLCYFQMNITKHVGCGSVLQAICGLTKPKKSPQRFRFLLSFI